MIPKKNKLTLFTVALALFMDVLDSNIINTAIPAMSKTLAVNPVDLKLALISYLLSLAIFIPTSGWFADKYGVKYIFIIAFGLFTLSSFWCGYSPTLYHLVISRGIQGIGGAFMISLGRLIIARSFKRHELVEAMNIVIIVVSMAVMLGPLVGGFITDYFTWPWIFWINIPIGIGGISLAIYCIHDQTAKVKKPFDWVGFILFSGSLSLLCYSLSDLSETNVNYISIIILLIISILMMLVYVRHAKKIPHPLIEVKLLNIRTFRVSVVGNLCTRLGFGGVPFIFPLLLQIGLGYSAAMSGFLLAPMAIGIVISKLLSAPILRRLGYKRYLLMNTLFAVVVLWFFQIVALETSMYTIVLLTFMFGIVISLQYAGMNSIAYADISESHLSASTSIMSTTQVLAQTLGVAFSAILLRYFSYINMHSQLTVQVFHQAFFALGLITLCSSFIFMRLKSQDGREMLVYPS